MYKYILKYVKNISQICKNISQICKKYFSNYDCVEPSDLHLHEQTSEIYIKWIEK